MFSGKMTGVVLGLTAVMDRCRASPTRASVLSTRAVTVGASARAGGRRRGRLGVRMGPGIGRRGGQQADQKPLHQCRNLRARASKKLVKAGR